MTTDPEFWTRRDWSRHVASNSRSSYGLAVCAAALLLAEHYPDNESEWGDILSRNFGGFSGFQANGAFSIARAIRPWARVNALKVGGV